MDDPHPPDRQHAATRPSRRDVLRRGLILGAAASAVSHLTPLAARAAGDTAPTPADRPSRGGTLRLGLGGGSTTDSLDPRAWDDSVMIAVGFALYNNLVENGPDNRPVPELAESWEANEGATAWVFKLRRGVPFSNGKAFDADDAVYSLNLHRGEAASGAAGVMTSVTGVAKLDAATIRITLASGDADFPAALTDYHVKMVPKGFTDWSRPVGTGAFVLDAFEPGLRIALRKAGPYWRAERGHLDAVEVAVINDTVERMNALIAGQVDAINRADPKTVSRIERSPTLGIVRAAGGWYPVMAMRLDRDPYTRRDLRLAMKHALDREQMVKVLFSGYGSLGNDHPIPRGDPYFHRDLTQLGYDPDRARFHFARAGVSNPKIVLQTSDAAFNGAVGMAALLQATAARCEIPLVARTEPADGYFSKVWLKGSFVASYWGGRPSATQMLQIAYRSGAPWNESHWADPAFDGLLAAAQAEVDDARRRQYIWDMQAMLTAESGTLIPCFRDWLDAHNARVGGHTPHSGFDMDNGRIAEKAWIRP